MAVVDEKQNSPLKLIEVVINLLKRNRVEEAIDLQFGAVLLAATNELEINDVMWMPIKDVAALSSPQQVPYVPQVEGWDKVWYGEAALDEHRG